MLLEKAPLGLGITNDRSQANQFLFQTTIMAVEFADGVIIAADSRTSTGSYVANRVTDKLNKITDKIYCCRSGSAADTQAIADIVQYSMNYHEYVFGERSISMSGCTNKRILPTEIRLATNRWWERLHLNSVTIATITVTHWSLALSLLVGTKS